MRQWRTKSRLKNTLPETNRSHPMVVGKMSFLFHWWDLLVPWRISHCRNLQKNVVFLFHLAKNVNFSVYLKISVLLNPKMCNVKLVDGIHWEVFSCLSNNSRYEMERTPQVILKLIAGKFNQFGHIWMNQQ